MTGHETATRLDGEPLRVGILGGTGKLGAGLAQRWARAGYAVTIGSRDAERAASRAAELRAGVPDAAGTLEGAANAVAAKAPLVIAAIPAEGAEELIGEIAAELDGAVLVSAVSPLRFDKQGPAPDVVEGAASAAEALSLRAPGARVVAGFHTVSAVSLAELDRPVDEDVPLCGDDEDALALVVDALGHLDGARPVVVGALRLAPILEGMTAVLIGVNRRYKVHAGLRVTGLDGH